MLGGRFYCCFFCFVLLFFKSWIVEFYQIFFCFYIYFDDYMTSILQFFSMLYITRIDMGILDHLCIPGINPTWFWCVILFMHCSIQLVNIMLRIFECFYQWYWHIFFFSVFFFLSSFKIKVMLPSQSDFGSVFISQFFG